MELPGEYMDKIRFVIGVLAKIEIMKWGLIVIGLIIVLTAVGFMTYFY